MPYNNLGRRQQMELGGRGGDGDGRSEPSTMVRSTCGGAATTSGLWQGEITIDIGAEKCHTVLRATNDVESSTIPSGAVGVSGQWLRPVTMHGGPHAGGRDGPWRRGGVAGCPRTIPISRLTRQVFDCTQSVIDWRCQGLPSAIRSVPTVTNIHRHRHRRAHGQITCAVTADGSTPIPPARRTEGESG